MEGVSKLESHYRRQYTQKIYFQKNFKSYANLYDVYSHDCDSQKENGISPVSFPNFMQLLKKKNYSILKPRNDICDTSVSFSSKNISQKEYDFHRMQIEDMREEKNLILKMLMKAYFRYYAWICKP